MSVIVGICDKGVVYMGCDTQTSYGDDKENRLAVINYKIDKLDNGVLVGICGAVSDHDVLRANSEIFAFEGELTMAKIVNDILPKIRTLLNKHDLLDKHMHMDISIILAHKDKMYNISSNGITRRIVNFCYDGSGGQYTKYYLMNTTLTVRERILNALRISAKIDTAVSAPFVLIDTQTQEYEIVEK